MKSKTTIDLKIVGFPYEGKNPFEDVVGNRYSFLNLMRIIKGESGIPNASNNFRGIEPGSILPTIEIGRETLSGTYVSLSPQTRILQMNGKDVISYNHVRPIITMYIDNGSYEFGWDGGSSCAGGQNDELMPVDSNTMDNMIKWALTQEYHLDTFKDPVTHNRQERFQTFDGPILYLLGKYSGTDTMEIFYDTNRHNIVLGFFSKQEELPTAINVLSEDNRLLCYYKRQNAKSENYRLAYGGEYWDSKWHQSIKFNESLKKGPANYNFVKFLDLLKNEIRPSAESYLKAKNAQEYLCDEVQAVSMEDVIKNYEIGKNVHGFMSHYDQ